MELDRVDPELRPLLRWQQRLATDNRAVKKVFEVLSRAGTRIMPVPRIPGVKVTAVDLGGVQGRYYRPERPGPAGLMWIHGGGLMFGSVRQDEAICGGVARRLGVTVFSAEYRLAPRHPFPAALDDLDAAWRWFVAQAPGRGLDVARIALGGESAGGGLAAALAQRLLDEGGPQPCAQWLFAPMLDDRTAADDSLDAVKHFVWNNADNRTGWTAYLGVAPGSPDLPPYASPARREDLAGLPPAYLQVGDIELFAAETEAYAARLQAAGVGSTLHLTPGIPHGLVHVPQTKAAQALQAHSEAWLQAKLA
jgi:acetyl esterase/lipase